MWRYTACWDIVRSPDLQLRRHRPAALSRPNPQRHRPANLSEAAQNLRQPQLRALALPAFLYRTSDEDALLREIRGALLDYLRKLRTGKREGVLRLCAER